MSEEQKALRAIKLWLIIFVLFFAFWAGASLSFGTWFVREVRAFNECHHVEDRDFKACFEAAKR